MHRLVYALAAVLIAMICHGSTALAGIRLLDSNRTFSMYDLYGETDSRHYDFRGPLLRASFVPNRWCTLNPKLPTTNSTSASSGTAIFIDADEMYNAGCPTFSWVLRSLPRGYPGTAVPANASTVMIFVSADDSSVTFGCKEIDVLDDYWYVTPPRIQLALVSSDTGDILSAVTSNKSTANSSTSKNSTSKNSTSTTRQPPIVYVTRDAGPWNRYLHSVYFTVITWFIRISDGGISVGALIILILSYTRSETRPTWFKPMALIVAIEFMISNMICQVRLPNSNSCTASMYSAWLIGNTFYTWILVKWARFMTQLSSRQHVPYKILLLSLFLNVVFFGAGMITSIVAIYSKSQSIRMVGFQLYTVVASALFGFEAIFVLYAGWLYIAYLREVHISREVRRLLIRESASLFVFCVGRMGTALSAVCLATKSIRTIPSFEVMSMLFHVGVIFLFGAVVWMMSLPSAASVKKKTTSSASASASASASTSSSSTNRRSHSSRNSVSTHVLNSTPATVTTTLGYGNTSGDIHLKLLSTAHEPPTPAESEPDTPVNTIPTASIRFHDLTNSLSRHDSSDSVLPLNPTFQHRARLDRFHARRASAQPLKRS
ncbi:hypothetical protein GQ42DRAFT_44358 [Ramicandelaber brevisporus]|nr:hypothetical protein GQ42DRAFT_44358 [Ramicandelaber brevisporus]